MSAPTFVPPLDIALRLGRQALDEAESTDIADTAQVVTSHAEVTETLRQVLDAFDAEEARG